VIIKKVKEGNWRAGQRHLFAKASITDIAAEVENDWWETRSGSWGDN
jgi:hypothetical protein